MQSPNCQIKYLPHFQFDFRLCNDRLEENSNADFYMQDQMKQETSELHKFPIAILPAAHEVAEMDFEQHKMGKINYRNASCNKFIERSKTAQPTCPLSKKLCFMSFCFDSFKEIQCGAYVYGTVPANKEKSI